MWNPIIHVLRIKDPERGLVIELSDRRDLELFKDLLRDLGVTLAGSKHKPVIRFNIMFREYLIKDRGLQERTARDYMNYLKRLDGKSLSYETFLEISGNKWMVKCVRLYVDFLEKLGELSDEEAEKLKKIFKVRNGARKIRHYGIEYNKLTDVLRRVEAGSLYWLVLNLLYYSGTRVSEVVEMIRKFEEEKLICFQDEGFCRYLLGWIRGRKRCEWIYFPSTLVDHLRRWEGSIGKYDTIRDALHDYYCIKLKDYRKLFYRVCREAGVEKSICDFYQSRLSALSIGDLHYDDLISRADREYPKLLTRLNELLA